MEELNLSEVLDQIVRVLNHTLFTLGEADFSLLDIFIVIGTLIVLFYASARIEKIVFRIISTRNKENIGTGKAISAIIRYIILVVGLLILFETLGIDMSTLTVLFGALGVGIGFGLQNIVNNFISGLIILFERPIKVGDRIEVGNVTGDVINISARASTVNTNDNITIIIPNSEFTSNKVINWSHSDRRVRFRIPVGVSYNEDPEEVRRVLLYVASKHPGVMKEPESMVVFEEYGESSLNFNLVVWTADYINRPRILKSELYYEIFKQFKKEGIQIPFPQRDLHLKSGFNKEKISKLTDN